MADFQWLLRRTVFLGGQCGAKSLKHANTHNPDLLSSSRFSSAQSLNCVQLFVTPWTVALQASLSITNSWSLLNLMSIESVMPSNHLILCHLLLLLPSIFPSIRVFSNESALCIRRPTYWSFSFGSGPPNKYSILISFRIDKFKVEAQKLPSTFVMCFTAEWSKLDSPTLFLPITQEKNLGVRTFTVFILDALVARPEALYWSSSSNLQMSCLLVASGFQLPALWQTAPGKMMLIHFAWVMTLSLQQRASSPWLI